MNRTVLVTGATGNVGTEVVTQLVDRGAAVRAAVIDEADAERLPVDVEHVLFDFIDPATFPAALAGVDRVFLMRPPHMSDADAFEPFLAAMKEAGVEQVVFLSLMGAEKNPVVPHRAIETRLRASGLGWTMLRPSFFMQNLTTTHLDDIRERDEIFVPGGGGATSFIDARDIGEAAAVLLTEDGHVGEAYTISGSTALSYGEAARIMSDILGREITYARPSGRAFAKRFREKGYPKEFITVMRGIYTVARLGLAAGVTDELEGLLGRPPRTFEEFVADHRDVLAPARAGSAS